MWQCSKCGQKSEKKVSHSNGCEHQWWDEHDIAEAKEKQSKEEKINRAVFAFNDELLNTEGGEKKLKGESGWSWLKEDIAQSWLNSSFGEKWLAGKYGKQYLNYLDEKEKNLAGSVNDSSKIEEPEFIDDEGGGDTDLSWLEGTEPADDDDYEPETGTFIDPRDGRVYKTVKIGNQVWMAENLAYDAKGSKCCAINESNVKKYGRLYNWNTAMKVCPPGWHLPSGKEWQELVNFVGGEKIAGKKLKATSWWDGNGTDEYGFSALPGGIGYSGGSFDYVGINGFWWSASEKDSDFAYGRGMRYNYEYADYCSYYKSFFFSVRCLQDYGEANRLPATEVPPVKVASSSNTFTDPRDGKTYKTVKIGEQVWMAENLAYNAHGSRCYNNDENNCKKYGRLYDWETAMNACPKGWHLPSNEEWQELADFAGGSENTCLTEAKLGFDGGNEIAGDKLKATSGWNKKFMEDELRDTDVQAGSSGNGTDDFGFSALPGGHCLIVKNENYLRDIGSKRGRLINLGNLQYLFSSGAGIAGLWWSSNEYERWSSFDYTYTYWIIHTNESGIFANGGDLGADDLLSVRCIKNDAELTSKPEPAKAPKIETPTVPFSTEDRQKMLADALNVEKKQSTRKGISIAFFVILIIIYFCIDDDKEKKVLEEKAAAERAARYTAEAEVARLEKEKAATKTTKAPQFKTTQNPTPAKTPTPSFNCAKASTPSEIAICSDFDLAELDNRLAKVYSKARSTCQKDVKAEQKEWLKEISSCLSNIQCLKNSYTSRIQELENCW